MLRAVEGKCDLGRCFKCRVFAIQMRPQDARHLLLTEPGPEGAVMKQEVPRWARRAGWSGKPGRLCGQWHLDRGDSLGCCLANIHSLSPTVGRERKVVSFPHQCQGRSGGLCWSARDSGQSTSRVCAWILCSGAHARRRAPPAWALERYLGSRPGPSPQPGVKLRR